MFGDIAHGHATAADIAFLVAVIACALAVAGVAVKRAATDVGAVLAVALGAIALGLLLL